MQKVNKLGSNICDNEYKSEKAVGQDVFCAVEKASVCDDEEVLGTGFLKAQIRCIME